ncbi:unnamed protein product [marine sediment metagenome]|uniref:N-sulphoglucosamine sulphohydrolase C-terminal domain-containing protein n=1 Tax=marine sediment metagenome TaxID=412755 RepID=X0TLW2_9ZZZZ
MVSHGVRPNEGLLRYYRSLSDATTKYIAASDGSEEFYNIMSDPGELRDLSSQRLQLLRNFSEYLAAWHESTPEFVPVLSKPADESESQIELLRALGYVGS